MTRDGSKKKKTKKGPTNHFVDRFNEINYEIEEAKKPIESKPSQVVDIGEKYQLITGRDEYTAGNLSPKLLPNLHQRWIPSELSEGRPYNKQLYKDAAEQEFYETFIQPLFAIYRTNQYKKKLCAGDKISRLHWEKKINLEVLGPEKVLFDKPDGDCYACVGEIETTLILTVHLMDNLYKYGISKIARRFGCSTSWIIGFKKKIQKAYGKLAVVTIEDHLEKQLNRCEGMLDTFLEKARDGDPIAAKIVKDFMDKEDQYIMPTLDQMPAKDTEEKRNETMIRLEKIFARKQIEDKNE